MSINKIMQIQRKINKIKHNYNKKSRIIEKTKAHLI